MKVIYNSIIPFPGFAAINLFGVVFAREGGKPLSKVCLNHEAIHTRQMREMGYLPFYLAYLAEWLVRLFLKGNAYESISFEREAYKNEYDMDYLSKRKPFAMWR